MVMEIYIATAVWRARVRYEYVSGWTIWNLKVGVQFITQPGAAGASMAGCEEGLRRSRNMEGQPARD